MIEAHGLKKRYPNVTAVDNVSFTVNEGEVFGLIGPNGAGKTTTLRILTGIIRPDEGIVYIMGENIHKDGSKIKMRIGVVPQNEAALELFLTVWSNLDICAKIYGIPRQERIKRINEVLELFEIKDLEKRIVDSLSPGQMRRVQLARAFLHEPQLLFLDEPSLGLDPYARRKLWEIIRSESNKGKTIFLTSHSMEEVEALCSRIAVIERGRVIALGSLQQLMRTLPASKVIELSVVNVSDIESASIRNALYDLSGVKEVYTAGCLFIYVEDDSVAEDVMRTVKKLGLRTAKIISRDTTLEDVYLRLTGRRFE